MAINKLIIENSSGNVGIGTTNPTQKLQVIGAVQADDFRSAISSQVFYLTGDEFRFRTAGGTERTRIDSSGNVGIGTTTPSTKLHVVSSGDTEIRITADNIDSTEYDPILRLTGQGNSTSEGFMLWYDNSVGDTYFDSVWAGGTATNPAIRFRTQTHSAAINVMTINHNGNVAIGTTNPTQKLHLSTASGAIFAQITSNTNQVYVGWDSVGAQGTLQSNAGLGFFTGSSYTQHATITTAGNVGIGTTTPGYKLDIVGGVRTTTASNMGTGVTQGGPTSTNVTANATLLLSGVGGNYLAFGQYGATGTYAQWIQSSFENPTTATYNLILQPLGGNVGIGTISPAERLTVVGGIESRGLATDANYAAFLEGLYDSTHALKLSVKINDSNKSEILGVFADGGGANPRTVINPSNGWKVGIGIDAPAYKLHVRDSTTTGNIAIGHALYPGVIYSSASSGEFRIDNRSSSSVGYITFYPNGQQNSIGTEALRINVNGHVGVGDTNPAYPVTIRKKPGGNVSRMLAIGNTEASGTFMFLGTSATTAGYCEIQAITTEQINYGSLVLNREGGNVGVAISSPTAKFHVNGTTTISRLQQQVYSWQTTSGSSYVHIKTSLRLNVDVGMWIWRIYGYSYGSAKTIDSYFGMHSDSSTNIYSAAYQDQGEVPFCVSMYKSSDNYLVLVGLIDSTYFFGFDIDVQHTNGYGYMQLGVLAVAQSASTSGVY